MGCHWEIALNDVEPLPGKMDELLSILKEYRFNIYYDIGTRFDASFYDWRSYDLADDLCADIAPLIASGSMHAKSDEDEDDGSDGVIFVFKNGTSEEVASQSFAYYDGLDDPLEFAKGLPDSVIQAILANADVFKSAQ